MSSFAKQAIFLLLVVFTFLPGCASQKEAQNMVVKNVDVYIEGRYRGTTPATINVYRNRGEYAVVLLDGRTVVRHYEIGVGGEQRGPERHILDMDLERDNSGFGLKTFGVDDFETPNDTLFHIPYIAQPITIDDSEYGLMLVITDG